MFGMFPPYLNSLGYNVRIDSIFTKEILDSASTTVIINLDRIIPDDEKKNLTDDVKKFTENYKGNYEEFFEKEKSKSEL